MSGPGLLPKEHEQNPAKSEKREPRHEARGTLECLPECMRSIDNSVAKLSCQIEHDGQTFRENSMVYCMLYSFSLLCAAKQLRKSGRTILPFTKAAS